MTDLVWPGRDGTPIACRDKLRTLDENLTEARQVLQDAYEDAVLMGVDPQAIRAALAALTGQLREPGH